MWGRKCVAPTAACDGNAQVRPDSEQTVSIQAPLRRLSGALLIAEMELELKKSAFE